MTTATIYIRSRGYRKELSAVLPLLVVLATSVAAAVTDHAADKSSESGSALRYHVVEEQPADTFVGNVVKDAFLDREYGKAVDEFQFSFLTRPDVEHHLFAIDQASGVIKTLEQIDREVLCPQLAKCQLKFDVAIRPMQYFHIIKVLIVLMDINDNYPRFPQPEVSERVSEAAIPGTSFNIPSAVDLDSNKFGVQSYKLVTESSKFQLQVLNTADGGTDLRLILREKLDRESTDFYQLKILALDGGNPHKSGSIIVGITVDDSNDFSPKFENSSYDISVVENSPPGTTIIQVKATDPDQGPHGDVTYSFSKHTQKDFGHIFGLTEKRGQVGQRHVHVTSSTFLHQVIIRGNLDYEKQQMYLLSIIARDQGKDSLPAHATVVVKVTDRNDNAPKITVNTLTKSGEAEVSENARAGSFVSHISVVDLDSGTNGQFTCTLDNRNFHLQKMYKTEYKVVTATSFDRERRSKYHVSVKCRDMGSPTKTAAASFKVKILDLNDHTPHFTQDSYEAAIEENNNIGAFVTRVTATDADQGLNGHVTYSLSRDASRYFTIGEESGEIRAKVRFDHEKFKVKLIAVTATDSGDPPHSATVSVTVKIFDKDDEEPRFSQASYSFTVYENEPINTEVGVVSAQDGDGAPFNQFNYLMTQTGTAGDTQFSLDPLTGRLATRTVLDREANSVYHLVVTATSEKNEAMRSNCHVTVHVADKNDNAPIWIFPSPGNHTIHISHNTPIGAEIARLRAYDRDSDNNQKLAYTVISGLKHGVFTLQTVTGVLTVNGELKPHKDQTYQLELKVYDHGEPEQSSFAKLNVIVSENVASPQGYIFFTGTGLYRTLGLGGGAFGLLLVAVVLVVLLRRRQKRREKHNGTLKEQERMLPPQGPPVAHHNHTNHRSTQLNHVNHKLHNGPIEAIPLKENLTFSDLERSPRHNDALLPKQLNTELEDEENMEASKQPNGMARKELPPPPSNWLSVSPSGASSQPSLSPADGTTPPAPPRENGTDSGISQSSPLRRELENSESASTSSLSDSGRGPSGDEGDGSRGQKFAYENGAAAKGGRFATGLSSSERDLPRLTRIPRPAATVGAGCTRTLPRHLLASPPAGLASFTAAAPSAALLHPLPETGSGVYTLPHPARVLLTNNRGLAQAASATSAPYRHLPRPPRTVRHQSTYPPPLHPIEPSMTSSPQTRRRHHHHQQQQQVAQQSQHHHVTIDPRIHVMEGPAEDLTVASRLSPVTARQRSQHGGILKDRRVLELEMAPNEQHKTRENPHSTFQLIEANHRHLPPPFNADYARTRAADPPLNHLAPETDILISHKSHKARETDLRTRETPPSQPMGNHVGHTGTTDL